MMSDGLNQARALRVAEIMRDYQALQSQISQFRAAPSAEEYNEVGFALLRQCESDARIILAQPFQAEGGSGKDDEQTKRQLQRIIIDSAVRRFKVQKIYLRMIAAARWINRRAQVLQGARPNSSHAAALNAVTQSLRQELMNITDAGIEHILRQADTSAGKWISEDPPLSVILRIIAAT